MSAPRRRVRLRVVVPLLLAGVASPVAVAATVAARHRPAGASTTAPTATEAIVRRTLAETVTVPGEVGYGVASPVAIGAAGIVTWLPAPGQVLGRGSAVARVDDAPVVLLYGPLPMYRALTAGVEGRDVRQLEGNLRALGYGGFPVDDRFTTTTTAAVKRWQRDLGLAETGTVDTGRIVYLEGRVRVASRLAAIGAAAPTAGIAVTGTTTRVTAAVPAQSAGWARPGARVTVRFPDGTTRPGVVVSAEPPSRPGPGADPGGDPQQPGGADTLSVAVRLAGAPVRIDDHVGVEVRHVLRERRNVLTVPVVALLALAEGGYGVEIVKGAGTTTVAVRTGMFADGQVEISAPELREGQRVGVPG